MCNEEYFIHCLQIEYSCYIKEANKTRKEENIHVYKFGGMRFVIGNKK